MWTQPEAGLGATMATDSTILLVEDDQSIADSVAYSLRQEGFEVAAASDGPSGLAQAIDTKPDLVILDLMLPGLDGLDVFRALRKHSQVPVIMLTAKDAEADRVAGIELGADDYITKPFYMRELVARVKLVLRRAKAAGNDDQDVIKVRDVVVDRGRRLVTVAGNEVSLTPQEFALLECLARNGGRALTREIILEQAWDESEYIDVRTVDVHVRWLRQKIEEDSSDPRRIITVRGVGYKLAD